MNFNFWKTQYKEDESDSEYSFSLDSLDTLDERQDDFGEVLVYAAKIQAIIDNSSKEGEILIEPRHINSAFGEILCEPTRSN